MGWLSKVGELIGLNPDKAYETANNVIDGVKSGLDKAWYTDEEKADTNKALVASQLKFVEMQRDENSVRSRARRVLAFGITAWYLGGLTVTAVVYRFDPVYARFLYETVSKATVAFGLVIGFYFGVHLVRGARK